MSCIHIKFVLHAIAKAATAAITSQIGESKNHKAAATVLNAAVIAGKTIQTDHTAKTKPAKANQTPPTTEIVVCMAGLKLLKVPFKSSSAFVTQSIAGRKTSPIEAQRFTSITSILPISFSKLPERLSSLTFACSAASVPCICALSFAKPSAPCSANQTAALMASVPKIVLNAWFFCSSDKPFKLFCKIPEISPILFSFPVASKNWFCQSFVIIQRSSIAAAALLLAGTNLCKNTLKDVPASDPLAKRFEIQAIDALKSSKLTQTAFATHHPCANAKA